jgi:hypothetical protein
LQPRRQAFSLHVVLLARQIAIVHAACSLIIAGTCFVIVNRLFDLFDITPKQ